jgi:hypothetical protein
VLSSRGEAFDHDEPTSSPPIDAVLAAVVDA